MMRIIQTFKMILKYFKLVIIVIYNTFCVLSKNILMLSFHSKFKQRRKIREDKEG